MITCLVYLRSPGGSIREVRRLRTRSHTFLASRREPLAGSGVLGVIMAEQVSRPLAPRPLSPHGCGRGQCVGGYGTRPRAKAVHLPEGGTPMVHFATNSFGGRRVATRLSPCGLRYAEYRVTGHGLGVSFPIIHRVFVCASKLCIHHTYMSCVCRARVITNPATV